MAALAVTVTRSRFDGNGIKRVLAESVAAPGVDDDTLVGYEPGSEIVDTSADDDYVCLDAAAGAAVWKKTTP